MIFLRFFTCVTAVTGSESHSFPWCHCFFPGPRYIADFVQIFASMALRFSGRLELRHLRIWPGEEGATCPRWMYDGWLAKGAEKEVILFQLGELWSFSRVKSAFLFFVRIFSHFSFECPACLESWSFKEYTIDFQIPVQSASDIRTLAVLGTLAHDLTEFFFATTSWSEDKVYP